MMMVLDKPYVSLLLSQTLANLGVPAVKCGDIRIPLDKTLEIRQLDEVADRVRDPDLALLCNSEYAVASVYPLLKGTPLMEQAELFKNKIKFRETLRKLYPDFFFRECSYEEIFRLPVETLPFPLVVKPTKGFRSVGVYLVEKPDEWPAMCKQLQADMRAAKEIYPESVVSASSFILEAWIQGDEYAVDAFYDAEGEPVVLNVFKRMFAHEADTSDRIYFTGKSVLQEALSKIEAFMKQLGSEMQLRRFPMHFEVRISKSGQLIPPSLREKRGSISLCCVCQQGDGPLSFAFARGYRRDSHQQKQRLALQAGFFYWNQPRRGEWVEQHRRHDARDNARGRKEEGREQEANEAWCLSKKGGKHGTRACTDAPPAWDRGEEKDGWTDLERHSGLFSNTIRTY
ncbi:ATP-grasp domain-containing protein [Brevibacillus sp. LEMMJ03]|uniref:ATP-grasp domain-containing protein n=1 Tax=Brevibacillus sp. LEMMJ03 TaxID=2595056 RepID=UPI00117D5BAD|nr:ATP-grasp domain-containing protein [Brevibacillus sp. LEMMJ03]TRY23347.1 ATP-grasp domain-containing protein [Brevibacillus sp. LEMMJ03]